MSFFDTIKNIFSSSDEETLNTEIPNSLKLPNVEVEPEVQIISSQNLGYGSTSSVINFDATSNNIKQLILTYRDIALYPEVDSAVQEITNESVVLTEGEKVVELDIESDEISENIKEKIKEEFDSLINIMDFNIIGDEYFRQWYEDGRIYLHGVIDLTKTNLGIQDIKILTPFNLKKVKIEKEYFYLYDDPKSNTTLKIPAEHITYCSSGLTSSDKMMYISYLHRAIKPFNQLKMLEDSAVIYRITRAPERRVFYVDVGQMNKSKAESYMTNLMNRFKNKIIYDSTTGKINQQKNTMTMTEDFWLPSSESGSGSRGTRIETLPAGQNLSELGDLAYFKRKLLKSLRVPYSRFDAEEGASILSFGNMNGEMSRDEVRFSKFISKLRSKFGTLFFDLLKKQVILKKIISAEEWVEWNDYFRLM